MVRISQPSQPRTGRLGPYTNLGHEVRRAPPGLACGLALAVRPAGLAEVSRVNGARRRRVPRSGMRSTVEAGGASPDNARIVPAPPL